MRRLCRFFVIFIAACAVVGCAEQSEDEVEIDFMWVVPNQFEYKKDDPFLPSHELEVWTSYQGGPPEIVPLTKVTIQIAKPPYDPEKVTDLQYDKTYLLDTPGTNLIIVEYANQKAISPIEVVSPPAGGTLIEVIWG